MMSRTIKMSTPEIADLEHQINFLAGKIFDADDTPATLRHTMAQHMDALVAELEILKLTEKLLA